MPFMSPHQPYERPAPLTGPLKTRAEARLKYAEIVAEMEGIGDRDTLEIFLMTVREPLIQFEDELPFLWEGDGKDFAGLDKEIKKAWRRVTADW